MSSRNKKRFHRRERRKAKASGWKREIKRDPGKVGHGGNGDVTSYVHFDQSKLKKYQKLRIERKGYDDDPDAKPID